MGLESDTLLGAIEVRVEPFALCEVHRGHQLDIRPDLACSMHYVLQGSGTLHGPDGTALPLQRDQMIIVPRGLQQNIESAGQRDAQSAAPVCLRPGPELQFLDSDGESEGDDLILACGRLHATYGADVNLFELLDAPLVGVVAEASYQRATFELMLEEFCRPRIGTGALTATLMKQSLILMLRSLLTQENERIGWLSMLGHRGLQHALQAMLSAPERGWRVEELADVANMSRSAFAERFVQAIGVPPHEFLSNYRLQLAARLLVMSEQPVKMIAARVGFKSRSSFSRAFRNRHGTDPAGYRRAALEAVASSASSS